MDILNLELIKTLPQNHHLLYKGMAFDGQFYYLTVPEEKMIYVMDNQYNFIRSHNVSRPFAAICYNNKKQCFFAVDIREKDYIYQLNNHLEEINYFYIDKPKSTTSKIHNLSYNLNHDTLVVVYNEFVLELSDNHSIVHIIDDENINNYCQLTIFPPFHISIIQSKGKQYLCLSTTDNCCIKKYCIPHEYRINDFILNQTSDSQNLELIILATQCSCQPCLLHCIINIEICPCNDCEQSDKCQETKRCNCQHSNHCCMPCINQSICDLIESIALQETALSHILNAEGEKLQHAIKMANNICELIEIDNSVQMTINNVMLLENVLYTKLNTLQNLCLPKCSCLEKCGLQ